MNVGITRNGGRLVMRVKRRWREALGWFCAF